ncbi:hypothetical protein GTY41_04355 [Streptomyces sp. SID685]|uniref:hypothetical protein n=1 Tax=Streptomyces TaxID=1883 RepID=UPI00136CE994|nr:hypothetical protein [Streptomyces sp. SID685]MYR84197.1 hypothetical protein [Streptomyces sp. SID685]
MSDVKKDAKTVDPANSHAEVAPANVHITDAKDTGTMTPAGNVHITDTKDAAKMAPAGNVHITDAEDNGTFSPDNTHLTSETA